jgi:hypothetical protein
MLIPGLCADGEMMCSESASASEPLKYFDIASPAFGVVEPQEPESDIVFPGVLFGRFEVWKDWRMGSGLRDFTV